MNQSRSDHVKIGAALLVVGLGLVFFYALSDIALLYRVIGLLVAVGAGVFIFLQSEKGQQLAKFLKEAKDEASRVIWPTRAETTQTTLIVFVIVILVGLFLWLLDSFLGFLFRTLTGIGG